MVLADILRPGARAAVLLALSALAAPALAQQAVTLGRLFSTPQERARLDAQRSNSASQPMIEVGGLQQGAPGAPLAAVPAAAPAAAPEPLVLDGVVRRSDGKTTYWLNQEAQTRDDQPALQHHALPLTLPSGVSLLIKPGQSFNPANGTIEEPGAAQ